MKKKFFYSLSLFILLIGICSYTFADAIFFSPSQAISLMISIIFLLPAICFFIVDISMLLVDTFSEKEVSFKEIAKVSIIIAYVISLGGIFSFFFLPGLGGLVFTIISNVLYKKEKYRTATIIITMTIAFIICLSVVWGLIVLF